MDYSPLDLQHLANTIYGEAGGEDYNTMLMVGSSAINRLNANKKEFYSRKESPGNNSLINVINKGYYAARDPNGNPSQMFMQAFEKKFPDKNSENKYKQALSVASGLLRGDIEPVKGQFYFTSKEIKRLASNKGFDFSKVKEVGTVGKYKVFSY